MEIENNIVRHYKSRVLNNVKFDYAAGLFPNFPPFDYLVSVGILKTPRSQNVYDFLSAKEPSDKKLIGQIVTRENSFWDIKNCRNSIPSQNIVFLDGSCIFSK